jgi:hypothetical protein
MRRAAVHGAAVIAFGALLFVAPGQASAQRRERHQERTQERQAQKHNEKQKHDEKRNEKGRGKAKGKAKGKTPHRAALEEAYRVRAESVVRKRLNLTDDQMAKLRGVNSRLGARRRDLFLQERATRQALRAEVARGKGADQKRVAQLMNQAQGLQRQRMELQAQERKAVSQFLSPVQQAQYFGFQARLRKRVQELEEGGGE